VNKSHLKTLSAVLIAISIGWPAGSAQADMHETQVKLTGAEVITGANRLLGQPLYTYDFSVSSTFGFNTLDAYNPSGPLPTPLAPGSDLETILVTTFPNLTAVPPPVLPNLNVPLRDVGTFVNGLLGRAAVPFQLDPAAPIVGPTQAEPDDPAPITLGDWMQGSGLAITRCGSGENHASIFVRRLIPNRMYSVVGLWLSADGAFRPVSFGGVPNVLITDRRGNGSLTRRLNFCPQDAATQDTEGFRLIGVAVLYHSAHVAWGAIPTPGAEGLVLPPGSMVHGHLWFDLGAGRRTAD
jgi:hypothetical protein